MTNTQLSKALYELCKRHISVNYQETELIKEAARRLEYLGAMERPEGQPVVFGEEEEEDDDEE